jgi:hypothetical protein
MSSWTSLPLRHPRAPSVRAYSPSRCLASPAYVSCFSSICIEPRSARPPRSDRPEPDQRSGVPRPVMAAGTEHPCSPQGDRARRRNRHDCTRVSRVDRIPFDGYAVIAARIAVFRNIGKRRSRSSERPNKSLTRSITSLLVERDWRNRVRDSDKTGDGNNLRVYLTV